MIGLTDKAAEKVKEIFDLRPYAIVKRFGLKNPIFERTASYGHFGRDYMRKMWKFILKTGTPLKRMEKISKMWNSLHGRS